MLSWTVNSGAVCYVQVGMGMEVRDRRRAAGLTQQQLAAAAGMSVGALRDLEQGRTARPRAASLRRLRTALGMSPDQPDGRPEEIAEAGHDGVRLRVLGPLGAWRHGVPIELGGARQRAVLGLLALQPNVALHRDSMIEALWEGHTPSSSVKMVQAYVGRLRSRLDPGHAPRDRAGLIVSAGTRYRLRADARQLDLIAFGKLAARAQAARASGDVAAACLAYAGALDLWQGEPLADLDLLSAHPAVIALARHRAAVVSDFAETAVGAGLHDRALPHLQALAERDPLDERAHAWLMIALAGTGQQATALSVYDRLRRRLDEQLGVRPGEVLMEAHARVLRQDIPATGLGQVTLASRPAVASARQLPRGPGTFVGREREQRAIRALAEQSIDAASVCLLDGVAGVGKTALAIHAGRCLAELFPDGQLYADLRGFGPHRVPAPPGEALTGFLRALGVSPLTVPAALDEQAALYRSLLAGKRMLIVLDNAADAGQVRPLLPGEPGTLVLVTSRRRLSGLTARDGAVRLTLRPLAAPEAVMLLDHVLGRDRVRAEPRAAADISARCGLLPLALRIAADRAARYRGMPLADLADQLAAEHARLDVLDAGEEDVTAMRAVFSWSYTALPPEAARMFRLLGLHTGPDISVLAAAALSAVGEAEAGRLLELLASMHLIEESASMRYRLHDLLRVYAAELSRRDENKEDRGSALRRMLMWYLRTADHADGLLVPGRRHPPAGPAPLGCEPLMHASYEQALAWCRAEQANLVAAVRLADQTGHDDITWRFPVAMRGLCDLQGPWAEWLACADIGVTAARRAGDLAGQVWALDCLGHACSALGRFEEALDCYQRARSIRRETGDHWGENANSINNLGCTYLELHRFEEALDCFQQVLTASRGAGNKYTESLALGNLGLAYSGLGRFSEALASFSQTVDITREIGYRRAEGNALSNIGDTYRAMRQPAKAGQYYRQALAVCRGAGDRRLEAETLRDLGDLSARVGRIEAACQSWRLALVIAEDLGDLRAVAGIRGRLKRRRATSTDTRNGLG
jgi:DNA-binding SARP family transcriptional activator